VMAWWCTCYQFGGIVATAGAAWLLRFGWRAAFFVPSIILALVGILVFSLLTPGPHAPDWRSAEARTPAEIAARRRAIRSALRSPTLYAFSASYFAIKLIRYSLLFWLPYYLADELHYSASMAGYVSTGFEVGGTLGVVGMGLLTHRLRHVSRPLLASVTLLGLALALIVYQRVGALGPWPNALSLCLVGACLFGPDSIISGAAAQDAGGPHAAATATGMVNGIGSVGAVLQGLLNAWISSTYGWRSVFFMLIGFAIVAAVSLAPAFRSEGSGAAQVP
jgi:sugar phosphate permease